MEPNEKLIEHHTKEIELVTNDMVGFRTKSAFTLWIGPYVLLGSVIIATEGTFTFTMSLAMKIALIMAVLSYLILGILAGLIERGAWKRCNALRESILELSPVKNCKLIKTRLPDYKREKLVMPLYTAAFLIIVISFGAVLYLASGIESRKTSVSNATQLEATPNMQMQSTQ